MLYEVELRVLAKISEMTKNLPHRTFELVKSKMSTSKVYTYTQKGAKNR